MRRLLNILFVVASGTMLCMACATGISPADIAGGSGLTGFVFNSVSNPATVSLGESITFSVSYQGIVLELDSCAVKDSDGNSVSGTQLGAASHTDTECTYTAPSTFPDLSISKGLWLGTSSITFYVDAGIKTNPPAYARLTINLVGETDDTCITYEDCEAGQFCYFGRCLAYSDVGIDTTITCSGSEDCAGENPLCIPFDTAGSCQSYCIDIPVFYSPDLNPPLTEAECDAVEDAGWYEDEELCLTADTMECAGGNTACNSTLAPDNGKCANLSESECKTNNYYGIAWDESGDNTQYVYYNCYWTGEFGCGLNGNYGEDDGCTGGSGGYPNDWRYFLGTYTYIGETNDEACSPEPNGVKPNSLTVTTGGLFDSPEVLFAGDLTHYVFGYGSYDNTTGIAEQPGYTDGGGGYQFKVYLDSNTTKLIFTDSIVYSCNTSSPGKVYELNAGAIEEY